MCYLTIFVQSPTVPGIKSVAGIRSAQLPRLERPQAPGVGGKFCICLTHSCPQGLLWALLRERVGGWIALPLSIALLFWFPLCKVSLHISGEITCLCSSGCELDGSWPLLQRPGSTSPVPHGFSRALAGSHLPHVSLPENFTLLSRVRNKPYDVFGCWLNETNLISGNLHRIGRITSCSVLWLNNAFQVSCLPSSFTGSAASCWLPGGGKAAAKDGSILLSSLFVSSDLPSGS